MEAVFADGTIARTTLTLRVLRALGGPQVVAAISNRVIGLNTPLVINLAELFTDGDAETAVRLATTKGDIDMLLYPSLAPEGVANFMAYVNSGAYDNMAFHRLVPGFVLQGGDLRAVSGPRTFSSIQQLLASPQNEPGISNTRGTVAAAKVGGRFSSYTGNGGLPVDRSNEATYGFHGYLGDPNSATTNFFINLAGNQDNLDNQNGGFTAFGRVTNAGMAVTDAISVLPTGSYTNSESLIVDGSLSSVSGIPMDAATAPTTMDINKTVRVTRASAIQPLSYTISDGVATSVVATIENGNQLKLNGIAAGSRSLTVTARDLDGNTIGQTFTVTVTPGHKAPAITRQPVAQIVNVGDDVSFSVTATGTDLQYQWRRGGTNLEGKTAATLTLEDVQAGNAGEYDVVVSNATMSVISNRSRLSLRTPTDITGITNAAGVTVSSLLVNVGAALELKAVVVGAPEPVFTWKRGTTAIKGQTSSHLKIATAKLTDGGIYKGTAKNTGGTDSTTDVNVFVIDRQNQLQVHKPGVAIKLVAGISGPADQITYQWGKYNDTTFEPLLPSSARYTGVEDPTLTILVSDINQDSGAYACRVSLPDGLGTQITGVTYLSVANKPNLKPMTGLNEVPTGFVAVSYRYQVPYEPGDALRPSSFAASGLPPGLMIDAPTGIIYGIPTKSGQFTITVTAKNPSGTSNPVTAVLRISSMQAASTGSFVATIQASPTLNDEMGGRLDMTVTDSSSYSASVVMGKNTYKAAGKVLYSSQNSDGSVNYRGQIAIPRKNQKSLLLVFVVTSGGAGISGFISDGFFDAVGRLTGEIGRAEISGFRRFWNRSRNPSPYLGNLHLSLDLPTADIGKADIPQGSGFLRGTGSSSGTVSFAGRLADGTTVTTSSSVSRFGELILFRMLYSNRGSLSGRVNHVVVSSGELSLINRASGDVRWFKTDTTSLNPRSYPTSVISITLAVRGNYYVAPKPEQVKKPDPDKHEIVMGLPNVPGNAYLDFAEGGLVSGVSNPGVNFRITPANKASFTNGSNPGQVTLGIDAKTGLYSGAFNLQDGRSAAFRGLIIPRTDAVNATNANLLAVSSYGVGYFLLPGLTPTLKTSQILSGKVTLKPTPVEISPQPLDQTINPGDNVVFTIGVSGGINDPSGAVVTYRWYKDGVAISDSTGTTSISGATTNTLTLSSAQKANSGSYFCEVTQSVSIVRSNAAVLTVRQVVANVTLELQSESVVNLGDSVTFTTTAEGSAPLTYEWSKNGVILPDVTTSSYNINSVTVDDTGTYKVKVRNSITPVAVESPGVSLNVITPITSVLITRTPSTEFVATGEEVVFTATANGSSPAYQWRRNNVNIPNAFGRTFTINSVSNDDGGQYEVYVTNALTPTPVFSEINYLNVAAGITNIQLQKSYTTLGVLPNTSVTFTVTADGENITYKWYKNDVAISGQTSNSLTLNAGPNPTNNVPDVYSVKLFNAVTPSGISGGTIPLHVATPVTDVIVTRNPSTANVVAGSGPVVFTATPNGTGPYTYQWRKNAQILVNEQAPTFTLSNTTLNDTGAYDCIITNPLRALNDGITGDSNVLTIIPAP
jgi:cyclophilin family peptidyl-prolyl cis-trans isomerase